MTGCQCFMGLEFKVNEWVLIPRQDTETLVERVLEENRDKNSAILDVCTGSGCIAISLVKLGEYRSVTALDISKDCLLYTSMVFSEGFGKNSFWQKRFRKKKRPLMYWKE